MRSHSRGCLAFLLALACLLSAPAAASAVPLGVTGFFGNAGSASGSLGGEFGIIKDPNGAIQVAPAGVAVNDATGDIYVADSANSRIEKFDVAGNFDWALGFDVIAPGKPGNQPQNEVQEIRLLGAPTAGTFTLRYPIESMVTSALPFNAAPAQVQSALQALPAIGAGNVAVTVAPGGDAGGGAAAGGPWLVEFKGALADVNVVPLRLIQSSLTPSSSAVLVPATVEGAGVVEKCTVAADCKAGSVEIGPGNRAYFNGPVPGGGVLFPQGVAVNQVSGDLYVADKGFGRVQRLDAEGGFISAWGFNVARSGPEQSDEQQRLTVDAASGDYKLSYYAIYGRGKLTSGSTSVTALVALAGAFAAGQPVTGPGIAPGTTIAAVGKETLTLSAPATENVNAASSKLLAGPASTTAEIEWNEAAAAIEAKLAALPGIGAGNVSVSGGPGGTGGTAPYLVRFEGALANTNLGPLAVSGGAPPLAGGAGAEIASLNEGAEGFEVCEAAANCNRGGGDGSAGRGGSFFPEGVGYLAVAPPGAPNAGDVVVGEGNQSRVQEFTATGQFLRAFGWDTISSGPGNDAGGGLEVCRPAVLDICKEGTGSSGVGQIVRQPAIRVAVDTDGNIFTAEPTGNFRVQKFAPAPGGGLTPTVFNPQVQTVAGESPTGSFPLSATSATEAPTDIAIDPTDNHLYVVKGCTAAHCPGPPSSTERRLYEFDTAGAGTLVETHLAANGIADVRGLAVKAGGESAYLTAATPKPGVSIAGPPTPPIPTIEPVTDLSQECATFHGTVNPQGGGLLLPTFYRFEYRPVGESAWSKVPVPEASVGSGEAPVPVQQAPCSLQPNREYEVKLVAIKGGAPTATATLTFTTDPAPPAVQTFNAFFDVNSEELVLRGTVNPNNTFTTYYFEYGADPCSSNPCASVPEAQNSPLPSAGALQVVSKRLGSLQPETTYHFRLVADNGVEPSPGQSEVRGSELTFTTPAAAPACANEAVRTGPSARLPECRGFEWVSNGDSWGSGVGPIMGSIADSGERAQFSAQAFGQPKGVPSPSSPYISQRTDHGWSVRQMAPSSELAQGSNLGTYFMVAADLGSVLWPQSDLGQRLRGEVRYGTVDLEGINAWASDQLVPVEYAGAGGRQDEYALTGANTNLSTFVFMHHGTVTESSVTLLSGEPLLRKALNSNLYQVANGSLDLVNRGGSVTLANPLGAIGGACGAELGGNVSVAESEIKSGSVSADGSVIHFTVRPTAPPASPSVDCGNASPYPKRLFKRIGATTTVEVSACGKTPPASCTPAGDDRYRGASRDGSVTFFLSPRQLTDSDTDSGEDLYAYDESLPPSERLIQASAGQVVAGDHPTIGSGAEVRGVLDNSGDGSRAYFLAKGRLTAAATKGANNIYVFERDAAHPAGRVAYVGELASAEAQAVAISATNSTSSFYALPGGEGGDGHFLLFTTAAKLLPEDLDVAKDLYRYDDESGQTLCLSCMGEEEGLAVRIAFRPTEASWADYEQQARPASADASSVVFTTAEGLAAEDTNGASDAYLWREGAISLISPGSGEAGLQSSGTESGISPDGEDVFFITRTAMVGADANNGLDLYDARVGGGFAEAQPPSACESGEGCQGPPSAPPPPPAPTSNSFVGPGNQAPPKPCRKGQARKHGKCVKKKKKHGDKQRGNRAGNERGGKR